MRCQFMHIEAFGRKGAHKKNSPVRKYSMFDICAEMIREPHASSHVREPLVPEVIFGMKPQQAFALVNERAARAADKKGRKLRSDALVVLVGVASWPETVADIGTDLDRLEKYHHWRTSTIAWIKSTWEEDFISAVEHLDEAHPHIHFVIAPKIGTDRRLRIASVHPGHRAAAETRDDGQGPRDQRQAYKAAMVALQDSYYESVASASGLTRIGPRRQRLSRSEWTEQQRQADSLARQLAKVQALATSVAASAKAHVAKREKEIAEAARTRIEAARAQSVRDISIVQEQTAECIRGLGRQVKQLNRDLSEKEAIVAQQAAELASLRILLNGSGPAP
jgi:hypothetical protein